MKKAIYMFSCLCIAAAVSCLNGAAAYAEPNSRTSAEYFMGSFAGIDEEAAHLMSDGKRRTAYAAERFNFTVSSERRFSAVYFMWNSIPESYTVTAENNSIEIDDGFLHKLIEFDAPVSEFALECETGGELCEIYLFPEKDYPDFVQSWQPPCKQADIMVLSAHADDEYLMFGGTIPYYAKERELQVQVLYLTTHFDEQPRPHELLDGLWEAGVRNYPVFGIIGDIPYSPIYSLEEAANLYDFDKVLDWFTEQLRRFKPMVVVTHDVNGEYGHGAHMLAAKTVCDAVEISADPNTYPDSALKYGVWDVPKTYIHLWPENPVVMNWDRPLESFGGLTAKEAAQRSLDKHETQAVWEYKVGEWKKWSCAKFGLYRTLVGADETADFMNHVKPVEVITAPPETAPEPVETTVPEAKTEAPSETASTPQASVIQPYDTAESTDNENSSDSSSDGSGAAAVLLCVGIGSGIAAVIILSVLKGKKKL